MGSHLDTRIARSALTTTLLQAVLPAAAIILSLTALHPPAYAGSSRITTAHAVDGTINIDGLLNEPVWQQPTIGELIQVEPDTHDAPTQPTAVRVAFDEHNLYIGVFCFDNELDKIVAAEMGRDSRLYFDDNIAILLDTFHDGRNAYYFSTNPIGALVDGRITESRRPDFSWDGIWIVQTRILDDGWTAEFRIPFKTLAFHPNRNDWGFNIERQLSRRRERDRWASPSLNVRLNRVVMAGAIDGLFDLTQGTGLDIKPYVLGGYTRDIEAADRVQVPVDAGVDIFYRISANLVSSTTFNTDFAETEVDTRQVNLTRFSLFFPEKRPFFLEDAGVFDFGIPRSGGGMRGPPPDIVPFFSRRIGLVAGEPVPIRVGQKLTGKMGNFDVGVMNLVTGDTDHAPGQNLFVARTKANFWAESYVGALVTHGEPTGVEDNSLVGMDMRLATSDFLSQGKILALTAYGSKTQTPSLHGQNNAYGFAISYPNDFVRAQYQWQHLGENYNPALGYIRRNGVRKNSLRASVNPRPEAWHVRQVGIGVDFTRYFNLAHGVVETRELEISPFEIEFNNGEELRYRFIPTIENLFEPFDIRDDIVIPVGEYSFLVHEISYRSALNKPLRYDIQYKAGSFYTGSSDELSTELSWRSRNVNTSIELQQYWVRLEQGNFNTRLALMRFDYSFGPFTTLANFVQYDTESQNIGVQSRLRWILKPGNEIYLVFNHSWQQNPLERERFESRHTDMRAKLNYTFRF